MLLSAITISRFVASVALIAAGMFATGPSLNGAARRAKATIVVRMLGDASGYHFRPASVSAHVGDVVRFVSVSGAPHNVSFWEDSIPTGAAATLQRNMQRTMGTLSGVLLTEPNETYTVSLAGMRPGTFCYYTRARYSIQIVGSTAVTAVCAT